MTSLALWILWSMMQVGQQPLVDNMPVTHWAGPPQGEIRCLNCPKPEPTDVPAIQVQENLKHPWSRCWISNDPLEYIEPNGQLKFRLEWITEEEWNSTFKDMPKCGRTRWTCADKSRVLLTDESGKKHCVKF